MLVVLIQNDLNYIFYDTMITKDIPWYEWLYKISENWCVISYANKKWWCTFDKILKLDIWKHWYAKVRLYKNNISVDSYTSCFVCSIF